MPEPISDRDAAARALTHLTAQASQVFGALAEVSDHVLATVDHGAALDLGCLDQLEEVVGHHLLERRSPIWGLGFVADPGAFPDRGGLQWWCCSGAGRAMRRLVVSLDPASVDFYDYTDAPWFTQARERGANVTGPYVDATGTNEYVITFSQAVRDEGRFLGVAGADVLVGTLQSVMQPVLRSLRGEACLVDEEGVVIATNSPRLLAGTVPVPQDDGLVAAVAWAPWRLMVRPGRRTSGCAGPQDG